MLEGGEEDLERLTSYLISLQLPSNIFSPCAKMALLAAWLHPFAASHALQLLAQLLPAVCFISNAVAWPLELGGSSFA